MNEWLTVAEMSKETGIPEETIRRYINRHALHLQVKRQHKSYSIEKESKAIVIQIRQCYSDGMNADQVEDFLAGNAPTIITVNGDGDRVTLNMVEALSGLEKVMNERMDGMENAFMVFLQLQQQAAATSALPDPVQQRRERLNERLTERRIEKQLRDEAMNLWGKKPEGERMIKAGWFSKVENVDARERFVRDYVDERFEARMVEAYGMKNTETTE